MNNAMNASICGNIWISSSVVSPARRPLKRNRENAYAAAAPISTAPIAENEATNRVLPIHAQNFVSFRAA